MIIGRVVRDQPPISRASPMDSAARALDAALARLPRLGFPLARRRSGSMLFGLSLCVVALLSLLALTSAQTLRIPLQRRSLPLNAAHPTRSLSALSRQLALTPAHHQSHSTLNLAVDPSSVVPLRNYYNRMYTGSVSVGTPAHDYSLVFDTGSADMWLFGAAATSTKLPFVKYYDREASSTSTLLATPWSIKYGKGAASGHLVQDTVRLAGKAASGFTFAEATQWSDDFESPDLPLDGLLGLAFSSVSSANSLTLIDKLKEQGVISQRKFSFYLTNELSSNSPSEGSQFILGEPDLSLAQGNVTFMDVASTGGMWLLSMQGVNVGGAATNYCTQDCAVLIDTGTSFVGMPTAAFLDFARRVQAARSDCTIDAGSGLIRCVDPSSDRLPTLSCSLQGNRFDLKGSDYYQDRTIGIMGIDVGTTSSFWILGDTFLKTYFTVFDMDARQIGIAGAKPGLPYTPPSEDTSPLRRFTWQLVLLLASIVLAICLVLSICIRCCGRSSARERPAGATELQSQRPSYSSTGQHAHAQQPYVLQPAPPTSTDNFRSAAMHGQPRTLGAQHAAATRPPPPPPPPAAGNSQFARDFYAVRA